MRSTRLVAISTNIAVNIVSEKCIYCIYIAYIAYIAHIYIAYLTFMHCNAAQCNLSSCSTGPLIHARIKVMDFVCLSHLRYISTFSCLLSIYEEPSQISSMGLKVLLAGYSVLLHYDAFCLSCLCHTVV